MVILRNYLIRHYIHLGYQASLTDHAFLKYSLGFHNNVNVIDTDWTISCLKRCLTLLEFRLFRFSKCFFLNDQWNNVQKDLFQKIIIKKFYPWYVTSKLPFKILRLQFYFVYIVISRHPEIHYVIQKLARKKNIPSVHFIGSTTPPSMFEYFVPCNVLSHAANLVYTKLVNAIKIRLERKSQDSFLKIANKNNY